MNIPVIELVDKDGRPIPPEESPIDERTPPATTCTENPFKMSIEEAYDSLRWDGSLGGHRVRPSCDLKAKLKRQRKAKRANQKKTRKRNRG